LLLGGYHNIIRMYRYSENINVVSGKSIRLSKQEEKQLLMNFPELKAAFFSKVVLFVEGETEYGCMPSFSEKIDVDFDDYGICLINAEGEKNIRGMRGLLKQFGIDSVAIYDNDVHKESDDANIFYTNELCFESEIVSSLIHSNRIDIARDWIDEMEPSGQKLILDSDFVKKWYTKIKYDLQNHEAIKIEDIDSEDNKLCLRLFSAWLYSRKSILLGRLIGSTLNSELIPQSYKNVILRAKEVALNG
jgi:putative ATP-dependent endonuclease of OLD family